LQHNNGRNSFAKKNRISPQQRQRRGWLGLQIRGL
jgi:hypothetical protein